MWIKMKETVDLPGYRQLIKDDRVDLPTQIVRQLPKDSYKKTCAPWDDHKDVEAIEKAQALARVEELLQAADQARATADLSKKKADAIVHPATVAQDLDAAAKKAAEKAIDSYNAAKKHADKNKATEGEKEKADALLCKQAATVRAHERTDLVQMLAHAELQAGIAKTGLRRMDAEEAEAEYQKAADDFEAKYDQPAPGRPPEQEPDPQREANDQADQETEPAEGGDNQDDNNTEGQTVPSGENAG